MRLEVNPLCDPDISLSAGAISPLGRTAMSDEDPFKSESPTRTSPRGDGLQTDDLVEFPLVRRRNLIRLGEDLLHASSIPTAIAYYDVTSTERQYLSSISDLISRDRTSPIGLSPAETAALAGRFRKVPIPCSISQALSLTPLMVRLYQSYLPGHDTTLC